MKLNTTGVAQENMQDQAEADREFGRQCAEDVRMHRAGMGPDDIWHRPDDEPPAWVEQGWVFDGHGGMRRSNLARLRAWWHRFHDSWAYAVLVVLLVVCAVYAACCGIHDAICR